MTIDQLILWLAEGELQKSPVAITDEGYSQCLPHRSGKSYFNVVDLGDESSCIDVTLVETYQGIPLNHCSIIFWANKGHVTNYSFSDWHQNEFGGGDQIPESIGDLYFLIQRFRTEFYQFIQRTWS